MKMFTTDGHLSKFGYQITPAGTLKKRETLIYLDSLYAFVTNCEMGKYCVNKRNMTSIGRFYGRNDSSTLATTETTNIFMSSLIYY